MTKIILHLGAHRTGSTHVQGVMAKNRALLAAEGIVAPSQSAVSEALTKGIGSRLPALRGGFGRLRGAGGTVVVSDENMLGFLNNIFTHGQFYPDTARRMGRLKQLLPAAPERIVLAIRPYESFFPSAYGRWLAPGRRVLPRADIAALVLGLRRGWHDVLAEVAEAFPESRLQLGEYSPDPGFAPSQLAHILGPVADRLAYNPGYRWNRSMSARQTKLYEEAIVAGNAAKASEIRDWKRFKQPPLQEGFWDRETEQALQARYRRDRAAIIERFPAFVTREAFEGEDAG